MNELSYWSLSTFELINRIASQSDGGALNHIICHRKLISHKGSWYLFSEFLWDLRQNKYKPYIIISDNEANLIEKIDLIYDRTLQKFSVLKPVDETVSIPGPYCNQQYKRIYSEVLEEKKENPTLTEIDLESEVSQIFKKTVVNHLRYSWLEVCRLANRFYTRYRWLVGNEYIELKKPISIDGHSFRKWLNENIPEPAPGRRDEKNRVQTLINDSFGFGSVKSMEINEERDREVSTQYDPIKEQYDKYVSHNLYKTVAHEKAETVHNQRPAIRKLGKEKVKNLVLQILNMYVNNLSSDEDIAKEFGISKATFSRFAGRNWKKDKLDLLAVPDLWRNMAQVILKNPIFMETAISLGIGDSLKIITKPSKEVS